MFSYMSLEDYYRLLFALQYFWRWQISEVENMTPSERDIMVLLLNQQIEKEKKEAENN